MGIFKVEKVLSKYNGNTAEPNELLTDKMSDI